MSPSSRIPSTDHELIRMELSYCQRCGALRVHPAGEAERFCPACAQALRWIFRERAASSEHKRGEHGPADL